MPAGPAIGSLGSPGRSALVEYRRRRALELAAWTRSLAWRAPLVVAAGVAGQVLASQAGLPQAGLPRAGLVGLTVAALVGWRLRFRPSEQARTWQRGAQGERHTARLLGRLAATASWSSMTWPCPARQANVDHLVIGPTGRVRDRLQAVDRQRPPERRRAGLAQPLPPGPHPGDGPLGSRDARPPARYPCGPLLCVHGAHVQGGGLHAQGVAIVPAQLLRSALGHDRVLSDADVTALATTAWTSLRPAA